MSDFHQEHEGIAWREWGDAAFAEAKAQDKIVLLDIGAVWCHWCHVMDSGIPGDPDHTGTYSNPEVQARIARHFIPVKVDNDRRPDINARYNMGGWPTTAFLTPDGDTLYGETYVPPPRMVALLDYIADLYRNSKESILEQAAQMRAQRAASEALTASDLDPNTTATVIQAVKRNFDFAYGGFGSQPKFPHPDALRLTLEEYARTQDPELRVIAEKTLHGMADGGMYDQYAGGFFRYSTTRDWSIPHFEKMLEDNAKLTAVYALASQVLDDPYYLDVVKSAHAWLLSDMRDPETGAFAGSQDADKEEAYYGQPLDVRATLPTPFIDRTVYTGWNALMVSALVARYKVTGEEDMLDKATKTLSFINESVSICYGEVKEDDTADILTAIHHFYTHGSSQGSVGLLSDQITFVTAALDMYEATSNALFLRWATEAADFVTVALEDKAEGGFFDLAPDPNAIGDLARPKKEIGDNAEAALALIRLSGFTEDAKYRQAAERALRLFSDKYSGYGYFASSYARAVQAATAPGLHITIVGDRSDARTRELQQAAWGHVAPGKTTETLDADTAAKRGLPADKDGLPYATVCIGTVCHAPVTAAEEMRRQMREGKSEKIAPAPNSGEPDKNPKTHPYGLALALRLPLLPPQNWGLGAILFLLLLSLPALAQTVPHFRTAAEARAWGEARERTGQYEAAASAYEQEALIRRRTGDPQGAEFQRRRAQQLKTDVALAVTADVPASGQKLAKLEPAAGCYLGALDNYADRSDADAFGRRIGRPLALCYDYSPYGAPFPRDWARRQARAGRAIQIAWEPNNIQAVRDDPYLNRWAKDAAACGTPVFLRFGGEMNGNWTPWGRDPRAYRRAFRLVHAVVNRWASNVALVWAPGAVPTYNLDLYYPGDDVVDWVGISLYLVRFHDDNLHQPAWQENPASLIAPFYAKYAARKPLCLAECGVSRRSRVEGADADGFAAARIYDLLDAMKIRFPRLKMFCWYTRNNLEAARDGRRLNDYSLPEGSGALAAFRAGASDPYFLSRWDETPPYRYQVVGNRLPVGYRGSLNAAVSTYSLHPTVEITRGGVTRRTHHPFSVFVPPGSGPLVVTVRDEGGRVAKRLTIAAP